MAVERPDLAARCNEVHRELAAIRWGVAEVGAVFLQRDRTHAPGLTRQ